MLYILHTLSQIAEALVQAAGFGALFALVIKSGTRFPIGKYSIKSSTLIGVTSAMILLVILAANSILQDAQHKERIARIEERVAGLLAGNPTPLDNIEEI